MIHVGVVSPGTRSYARTSAFARAVYGQRLHAAIAGQPDLFAFASDDEGTIVGSFGCYRAKPDKPLLFESYIPGALERIAGMSAVDRTACAEIGTRAVALPEGCDASSGDVSLALAGTIIAHAHSLGIRFFGFTSNRTTRLIARALKIRLTELGEPDLSGHTPEFLANWQDFFRVPQLCFGFAVDSVEGCVLACEGLYAKGVQCPTLRNRAAA